MNYFHPAYAFLFLPIVILVYSIFPKKYRYLILLLSSYVFFYLISGKLVLFLLLSTISIYISALLMRKQDKKRDDILIDLDKEERKKIKQLFQKKKRTILIITILFNVSFLFFFKYLNFFAINTNLIFDYLNIDFNFKIIKHLAPIGISFYTLQALSYIIDVYNGKIEADNNLGRIALFLVFFPQIMEGPIARYYDTAKSLYEGKKVTYRTFCYGYQRILFGFFKKLVIADRINILVKLVFDNYYQYSGATIFLGIAFYTLLLYMEFSGTMDIVIGTGEIFGVKIPENFRQPFFAKNISEFWSRWHISLGLWFKDYIFYPASLSKRMKKLTVKARKRLGNHYGPLIAGAISLFAVWTLNGLWHGAGWTFLFFGMYHFALILSGNIFEASSSKLFFFLHIDRKAKWYRIFQSIKVTILVLVGELFFRAPSLRIAFAMLKRMFEGLKLNSFSKEVFNLGLDGKDFIIVIIAVIIIFLISLLKEKGINIRDNVSCMPIVIRWSLYYFLIFGIIIFGAYGPGYEPVAPIYADF